MKPNRAIVVVMDRQGRTGPGGARQGQARQGKAWTQRFLGWLFPPHKLWSERTVKQKILRALSK